jgi:hypothetical protein
MYRARPDDFRRPRIGAPAASLLSEERLAAVRAAVDA